MNSEFKERLRIFNAAKVRYLVAGGYAASKYTEPRYTKDLDLWVEASAECPGGVQGIEGFRGPAGEPNTTKAPPSRAQELRGRGLTVQESPSV